MPQESADKADAAATHRNFLDCKDLRCPMPIVRVSQAIKTIAAGETLCVEATDPAFLPDLQAWVRTLGHRLVQFEDGPVKRATIEKCSGGRDAHIL